MLQRHDRNVAYQACWLLQNMNRKLSLHRYMNTGMQSRNQHWGNITENAYTNDEVYTAPPQADTQTCHCVYELTYTSVHQQSFTLAVTYPWNSQGEEDISCVATKCIYVYIHVCNCVALVFTSLAEKQSEPLITPCILGLLLYNNKVTNQVTKRKFGYTHEKFEYSYRPSLIYTCRYAHL